MPFVKLDCGMLDSTIWLDREAREVFITSLLMAYPIHTTVPMAEVAVRSLDNTGWEVPPGKYGIVEAAGIGIIHRAGLDGEPGLAALERLAAPESDSRSQEYDGRRMVRVDGGYIILNYDKYRERDYTTAARSKRYRDRHKSTRVNTPSRVTVTSHTVTGRGVTQAEAEVEADTEATTKSKSNTARSRANWVRRLGTIWRNRYHGTPPWGQIGKLLLPVRDEPELDYRFTAYLAVTDPQFVNLAKFVASFGSWGNGKKRPQTYTYEPGHSGPEL